MSVADDLRDWIAQNSAIGAAPVWIDYLGAEPVQYALVSLPGAKVIETYINGSSLRTYPFGLQSTESVMDEESRLAAVAFYEALSDWFESQTEAGNLPALDTGKEAHAVEALGWGTLVQDGGSGTGVYQLSCRLVYEQK